MKKHIQNYLPTKVNNKSLIQARVDSQLVKDIKKLMTKYDLRWSEVVTACLKKMKEEMK